MTPAFHIYKFTDLLKYICNLRLRFWMPLQSFVAGQSGERLELPNLSTPSWAQTRPHNALPSCLGSQTINKHLFHHLFRATLFTFLCFCGWFCCLKFRQAECWSVMLTCQAWWLTPVTLATEKAEIRRITVWGHPVGGRWGGGIARPHLKQ
jgi:hypothetical protein